MNKSIKRAKKIHRPTISKREGGIHIVNLDSYSRPEVKEYNNEDWVSYGDNNDYFDFLIDRYNGSPTNNAAINGIAEMIYGKGLDATDSEQKPDNYKAMKKLLNKSTVKKVCYDYKMMGQAALQIIYSKDRKIIARVEHIPIQNLRAEKIGESGEIENYYYSSDWSKVQSNTKLKKIPAFGFSNEHLEIMYIKPYRAGFKYYSPVDYQGGLQYAELEEEVANYHINNIKNGLAPSMLINFNNGVPDKEQRDEIENSIIQKFSGSSNAGRFILAFNDSKELSATIEPVQLSDAHQQYEFLSAESMKKVMVSHRIVSPMLVGIKDNTGLGNNAEELQTASILMDNTVIRPIQVTILDNFERILEFNGIDLDIYFKTLQPLEFTDLTNAISESEVEKETGVKKTQVEEEVETETQD